MLKSSSNFGRKSKSKQEYSILSRRGDLEIIGVDGHGRVREGSPAVNVPVASPRIILRGVICCVVRKDRKRPKVGQVL